MLSLVSKTRQYGLENMEIKFGFVGFNVMYCNVCVMTVQMNTLPLSSV
jgi:hypothetical protein